ncbi:MAG: acyl-CoA dehydratase activase-related protein [Tissierellia bacterium]|nr:acyl-CoA dehydratase activase-related protein [Tissierellia bacterium]
MLLHVGLDVGSTTVKLVVLSSDFDILYSNYQRHRSDVKATVREMVTDAYRRFKNEYITIHVTGSGGMFVEKYLGIPFVQEVVAGTMAIRNFVPETDVAIELGGEDSKITYLSGNVEQRMNSICAGGTGAFIDQMASLMEMDASQLNEQSKRFKKIYPIASRCGVFAKTDIQALINQGASKEDISASVFQSVVNQTISNLACGRPIKGNIALVGGPLHFLDGLCDRFIETLGEQTNHFIIPENSQLFVAMGAALSSLESSEISFRSLMDKIEEDIEPVLEAENVLERLFEDEAELQAFRDRHAAETIEEGQLDGYEGVCYLGVDAGSTTSKVILIDEEDRILFSHYANNRGKPLELLIEVLKEIYGRLGERAVIKSSGITGYGEDFLKAAMKIDHGEVETIAHYRAAKHFNPDVDFILDIGGQDMKAMHISNGIIDSIQLNEACSSGCGSFIETFSKSLGMGITEFHEASLLAKNPVDLGSRCTVFMNSKVKQAQKEGAEVGDIAAGLCYSVIKNALQKVIKLRDPSKLGENIVVQGGTFYGDGILRAFEKISGREPIRPSIAGLMGAFGMALIAKERAEGESTLYKLEQIEDFSYTQRSARCGLCSNNCALTVNKFSDGSRYIIGNRCERGSGIKTEKSELPNLYAYKNKRLFDYESIPEELAPRGVVGIPRVLNIYENYPFWHSFFTNLGYSVLLSGISDRGMYEKGIASITSETACYPAKLAHGHIEDLVEKGAKFIFYPSIFYEAKEYEKAQNHLNCPVVAGYPEVIKNNVDSLVDQDVLFMNPFLSFDDEKRLVNRLHEEFAGFGFSKTDIRGAVRMGYDSLEKYREDLIEEGKRALEYLNENNTKGIVLAGRPYHIDPEINHGIAELITSLGFAVISEDALVDRGDINHELRVLDQWVYHSRLYRAAQFVGEREDLEMVQLNSFGCGIDAVTTDQVNEILHAHGKIYTVLKIDEVSNLGAVKIRLRSLMQAIQGKKTVLRSPIIKPVAPRFDRAKKKTHTILAPQMAPDHFELIESALQSEGYKIEFLPKVDAKVIEEGLKYVNNDACYPSITVVGQFMEALQSGKYDPDTTALLMSQTGGACRASNYVGFIRKALDEADMPQVPVIALSAQGIETSEGFNLTYPLIYKCILSVLLGDLLMRLSNATRPYERIKGSTDHLKNQWIKRLKEFVQKPNSKMYKVHVQDIVTDFDKLEIKMRNIPKVGIVGEILVKYLPEANNNLQQILEAEDTEVIVSDLTDFLMYCLRNARHKYKLLSKGAFGAGLAQIGVWYIEHYRVYIREALEGTRFHAPEYIENLEKMVDGIISTGNQYGEGWLLTAEMVELIEMGASNIVCIQPFGCLPNHITGKGVIKKLREIHPQANIIPIDYDPGASEVNQVNRIKLMLSTARENIVQTSEQKREEESKVLYLDQSR